MKLILLTIMLSTPYMAFQVIQQLSGNPFLQLWVVITAVIVEITLVDIQIKVKANISKEDDEDQVIW